MTNFRRINSKPARSFYCRNMPKLNFVSKFPNLVVKGRRNQPSEFFNPAILSPSRRDSILMKMYRWRDGTPLTIQDVADIPQWLKNLAISCVPITFVTRPASAITAVMVPATQQLENMINKKYYMTVTLDEEEWAEAESQINPMKIVHDVDGVTVDVDSNDYTWIQLRF